MFHTARFLTNMSSKGSAVDNYIKILILRQNFNMNQKINHNLTIQEKTKFKYHFMYLLNEN